MSIQDRPHKLTPHAKEVWRLVSDKCVHITSVTDSEIVGFQWKAKGGIITMSWDRYGRFTSGDSECMNLVEKVP